MMWNRCWVLMVMAVLVVGCSQPEPRSDAGNSESEESETEESSTGESASDQSAIPTETLGVTEEEMEARRQIPDVVERVMPAVVGITTERTIRQRRGLPFGRSPFGEMFPEFGPRGQQPPQRQERRRQDVGSGVIVDNEGIVLTNNHVVEQADSIQVNLSDGRDFETEVVGTDPQSDVAVLRIADPPDDLDAISFGDSDDLRLGESVIAIGNPFGLSGTVTLGIISAKGRADVGIVDYENFIQTDAAINPGNSGGALINLQGELVGINTAILSRTGAHAGIGFAIPSNMAQRVMEGLVEDGEVQRGWLGVVIQQMTPALRDALEIGGDREGVLVSDVQSGSPGEEAGLQRSDLIVEVDGDRVTSPNGLRSTIGLSQPGTDVEIEYIRDGESQTTTATLGSLSDARAMQEGRPVPGGPASETAIEGLQLRPLDSELRRQFKIPEAVRGGLVVTGIESNSEAAQYDLREGDVILEINRRPVTNVQEFDAAFDADAPQNLFLLYRDGTTIFMTQ